MKKKRLLIKALAVFLAILLVAPQGLIAQSGGADKTFKQEELDQLVAPIALYPDSLLAQVFMASTYPLEVVQAGRWVKANQNLKGDALTAALEKENWDPSVKSLVNFPQVLQMMSEKLDLTQKLGDAFLGQQKDVMATVQKLRAKAEASGNLKTTKEQVVKVEKEIIIIESASPTVIYVPAYNPTVVYGAWAYPAYPPYPYYPPGYAAGAAFVTGVAVGAAWGYAWGHSDWHGGSVNVNYNQNVNINNNINRGKYATQYPAGSQWKQQATPSQQAQARQAYKGYTGSALTPAEQQQAQQKAQKAQQQQTGQQGQQRAQQQQTSQQAAGKQASSASKQGGGAFEGMDRGSSVSSSSARGSSSRQSMSGGGGGASSGRSGGGSSFSGGGSRGGGGGGGGRR